MSDYKSKIMKIREETLFNEAKKIKFKDYDGKFILDDKSFTQDKEDIEDWVCNMIKYDNVSDEDLPKYLWATKLESILDLNLKNIIYDQCEDGYEDMYNYLDVDSSYLEKAQKYLDRWYEEQGENVGAYYYDFNTVVLLDDLIQEIKNNIKKGDKKEELKSLEKVFRENGYSEEMILEIKLQDEATDTEGFINNLEEEQSNWGE